MTWSAMNETNLRREMGNTNNCDYRVSLIIPIYNKAEWLDTCFHSILNQSIDHRHVEVLMIDDGSQDDSLKIMKRYADKYENFKWFTKENGGPAQARNVGIKYAAGKYIMYLDPDDWLGTNTIENVCKFFATRMILPFSLSNKLKWTSKLIPLLNQFN